MSTNTKANKPAIEESRGVPTLGNVVSHLWKTAAPHLSPADIEWCAKGTNNALFSLERLGEAMCHIGIAISYTDKSAFENNQISNLLFCLSDVVDGIHALANVGSCANDRLQHPERYA